MAVTYIGVTTGNSGGATASNFTTSLPAGWAAGDVAVLVAHVSGSALTVTTPAGWTLLSGLSWPVTEDAASRLYAWQRTLQAGDTAPTLTNSGSVTGGWDCAVWRGTSGVTQTAVSTASSATLTLPTLAGVSVGSGLLAVAHCRVASGTAPTGLTVAAPWVEVADHGTSRATSAANIRMAVAQRLADTAGSYGGETVTSTTTGSMIGLLAELAATPATTQVSGTATTGWSVATSVSGTRATSWAVAAAVGGSTSTSWAVASTAAGTRSTWWSTAATTAGAVDTNWSTAAVASAEVGTSWSTAATVGALTETRWMVLQQVGGAAPSGWSVAALVAGSTHTRWSVAATVTDETDTRWSVSAPAGGTLSIGWSTAAPVGGQVTTAWSVAAMPPPGRGATRYPAGSRTRFPDRSEVTVL